MDELLQEVRAIREAVGKLDERMGKLDERVVKLDDRLAAFELRQLHDMRAINAMFQRVGKSDELLSARVDELVVRIERLEARQ